MRDAETSSGENDQSTLLEDNKAGTGALMAEEEVEGTIGRTEAVNGTVIVTAAEEGGATTGPATEETLEDEPETATRPLGTTCRRH